MKKKSFFFSCIFMNLTEEKIIWSQLKINLNVLVSFPSSNKVKRQMRSRFYVVLIHPLLYYPPFFFFFLFFSIYSKFVPFASFPASSHLVLHLFECKWKLSYASVQFFEVSVQTRLDIRKNKLFTPSLFKHCIGAAVQLHYVTAVGKKQLILEKKFLNNNTDIITSC